ncbi:hypothetical protein HED48_23395 [Ochrobactrum intermedium]|nr:hypothetical protein [Brucella intermedia]
MAQYNRLGKDKAAALADVMHQSTIAQYDPSIDNAPGDRAKNAALQKAYDALPDAGKRLYQSVRDSYAAQTKELDGIILDNLKKSFRSRRRKPSGSIVRSLNGFRASRWTRQRANRRSRTRRRFMKPPRRRRNGR